MNEKQTGLSAGAKALVVATFAAVAGTIAYVVKPEWFGAKGAKSAGTTPVNPGAPPPQPTGEPGAPIVRKLHKRMPPGSTVVTSLVGGKIHQPWTVGPDGFTITKAGPGVPAGPNAPPLTPGLSEPHPHDPGAPPAAPPPGTPPDPKGA